MAIHYKVHPSIGIARLGDSPAEIMLAPQAPLALPTEIVDDEEREIRSFRDGQGRIKREAARFRVFAYDDANPNQSTPVEVGQGGVARIEWNVWIANKKAAWFKFNGLHGDEIGRRVNRNSQIRGNPRRKLFIDPGPRTLSAANTVARFDAASAPAEIQATFPPALTPFSIDSLGEIRLDSSGNLLVLGAKGSSGSTEQIPRITDYANNDGWFDDVADGFVRATIIFDDGRREDVQENAWVICGPPAYAPEAGNIVTLYDVMFDVAVRELGARTDIHSGGSFRPGYKVDFATDLKPFFTRVQTIEGVETSIPPHAHLLDWVQLQDPSATANPYRQRIFEVIRGPNSGTATRTAAGRLMMPYALGDSPYSQNSTQKLLTVTATMYHLLSLWADGNFEPNIDGRGPVHEGDRLDMATLENCVGGAFYPGIESTWIVRNADIYAAPFRVKHRQDLTNGLHLKDDLMLGLEPGDLTKRMALPWQADFFECGRERNSGLENVAWWPAQRPLTVLDKDFQPVEWTRGFVLNSGPNGTKPADLQMVHNWKDLGFIRSRRIGANSVLVETERNSANIFNVS